MKILTSEEAAVVEVKSKGTGGSRSKNPDFLDAVLQLEEGHSIIVKKDEWNGTATPGSVLGSPNFKKKLDGRRFHCFELKDESGWLIAPRKH